MEESHEVCAYCAAGEPMEHNVEPPSPVYVLWHGGPNYADPWITDDLEVFENVEAAHDALVDRERVGHWFPQRVEKLKGGTVEHTLFPCVERSWMEVYYASPLDEDGNADDNGPDLTLHFPEEENDE